jgi:hypothetical protein
MLAYTFLATTALSILLKDYCSLTTMRFLPPSMGDILISASIFCTLTITAIYESKYFMSALKISFLTTWIPWLPLFLKNLDIRVDIPETELSQQIVPLSLQMLMENAIKHNIVSEDHPLHIHIYKKHGQLVVSNNLQLKKQVSESIGIGLENISKRCQVLTDKLIEVMSGPDPGRQAAHPIHHINTYECQYNYDVSQCV